MSSFSPPVPDRHLYPIDGLRGIAALGVVLFHIRPTYLFWFWSMVDLFFVISGFVITAQLLRPRELHWSSLRSFWMRRVLRIFPLYFATLLLALGLEGLFTQLQWLPVLPHEGVWKYFVFLQFTELYVPGSASFDLDFPRYVLPTWSLAAEEQFYLIWPLILLAFGRRARPLALVCVALIAVGLGTRLLHVSPYLLFSRFDGLAAGILLALFLNPLVGGAAPVASLRRTLLVVVLPGLVGAVLVAPLLVLGYRAIGSPQAEVDWVHASIAVTGFVLIFTAAIARVMLAPTGLLARLLSHPVLLYLGSISFSVYLLHVPLKGLYTTLLPVLGLSRGRLLDLAYVLAVIGAAHLARNWIERPFQQLKRHFPLSAPAPSSPSPEGADPGRRTAGAQ